MADVLAWGLLAVVGLVAVRLLRERRRLVLALREQRQQTDLSDAELRAAQTRLSLVTEATARRVGAALERASRTRQTVRRVIDDLRVAVRQLSDASAAKKTAEATETRRGDVQALRRSFHHAQASIGGYVDQLAQRGRCGEDRLETVRKKLDAVAQSLHVLARDERLPGAISDLEHAAGEAAAAIIAPVAGRGGSEDVIRTTVDSSRVVVASAEQAYGSVQDVLESLDGLLSSTGKLSERLEELPKVTGSIEGMVRLIYEISNSTSLLALNASIIAVQAGEWGRSFTVVATGVKDLAERTRSSVGSIAAKVHEARLVHESTAADVVHIGEACVSAFARAAAAGDAAAEMRDQARAVHMSFRRLAKTDGTREEPFVQAARAVSRTATALAPIVRGFVNELEGISHDVVGMSACTEDAAEGQDPALILRSAAATLATLEAEATSVLAASRAQSERAWTVLAQRLASACSTVDRELGQSETELDELRRQGDGWQRPLGAARKT